MPWVTWVMLWVYDVGTHSSAIWCGLPYAVGNRCPHHIQPVVHGIYMVWGYAVGAHELCRCTILLLSLLTYYFVTTLIFAESVVGRRDRGGCR